MQKRSAMNKTSCFTPSLPAPPHWPGQQLRPWAGVGLPGSRGRKHPRGGPADLPSTARRGAENLSRQYVVIFKLLFFIFLVICWENEKFKQNMKTRDGNMRVYGRKVDLKTVWRKTSTFYCLIFQKTPKGLQNQEQFFSFKCLHFSSTILLS